MTLSLASVLHYWSARYDAVPVVGGKPVHARNSAAKWIDQQGVIQSAIVNTPRFGWGTIDSERRQVLRLEQARTNMLATALSGFTNDGLSITTGISDPAGGTGAERHTWSSGNGRKYSVLSTFSGDGTKAVCVPMRNQGTSTTSAIIIYDLTTGLKCQVNVVWTGGVPAPSVVGGSGTVLPVVTLVDGWYGVAFSVDSIIAAHVSRIEIWADLSAAGKSIDVYTPMVDDAPNPSSFVSVGATRAADSFYWDYTPAPQDMAIYVRFIERWGAINMPSVLSLGNGTLAPALLIYGGGSGYRIDHYNGASSVVEAPASGFPTVGQTVELIGITGLTTPGSVTLIQSWDGGAASSSGESAGLSYAAAWSAKVLRIGNDLAGASLVDAAEVKIVRRADVAASTTQGIMDELRAFELGPNGAVL